MKNKFVVLIFLILCCCSKNTSNKIQILKDEVINNADLTSYTILSNHLEDENNYQDLLPYSLKIKNTNKVGCYDFYINYIKIAINSKFEINNILKLEKPEQDFLIYILNKGALSDETRCKETLIEYYNNGVVVEKNLSKADSIYKSFEYPVN